MILGQAFDTSTMLVGYGMDGKPNASPPAPADPTFEYTQAFSPLSVIPVADNFDGYFCRHPLTTYRRMMRTPAIGSSIAALKAATLSGGIQLSPAVKPSDNPEGNPDEQEAEEIAQFCIRAQARMEFHTPLIPLLWEMMDALGECHKLAEIVMDYVADGQDSGKLSLRKVKTKPRWSYRFRVDSAMNVPAIQVWGIDGEWEEVEPNHFAVLAWDPKESDPRGTSVLDMAHHAWNMLIQLWPEAYLGWKMFGTPSIYGTTGPNEQMVPQRDAQGNPLPGKPPLTAQQAMAAKLTGMRNGKVVVGKHGSDAKVLESTRDGVTMANAITILEAEMIRAILLQVRATMEAKHGSKADGEIGQDVMGTLVRFTRAWVCSMWRKVLHTLVSVNFGAEKADRMTPEVSLGKIEPQDFAEFAAAIAVLYQSGYFTEGQLPSTDAFLGLLQRRPGDARIGPQKDNSGADPNAQEQPDPTPKSDPAVLAKLDEIRAAIASVFESKGVAA